MSQRLAAGSGESEPLGRRRRGCGCLALVIALVLVLGVAAVLDEVARRAAERRAASTLQSELGTSQTVNVHFSGWPFSTALVTGRVKAMEVTAPQLDLQRNGSTVTLTSVDVNASGVHDVRHPAQAVADHMTIAGTISWAELSKHAGVTLSDGGNGRAKFTSQVTVLGQTGDVVVTAVPGIDATTHKVTLTDAQGTFDGITVPAALLTSAASSMAAKITLPAQTGLQYTGLTAGSDGARVTLEGDNVLLDSLR